MFNSICDIFSNREKQLILQEKHDEILIKKYKECPYTIFQLICLERKINREQFKYNDVKLVSIISNAKNNIQKVNNYQSELEDILSNSNNICHNLNLFINKYQ